MFPNLDAEMARKKITRTALAERIKKTPTTLCLKLNGKAPLTLAECIEIKNAVNPECTVDYLFETEEKPADPADSLRGGVAVNVDFKKEMGSIGEKSG